MFSIERYDSKQGVDFTHSAREAFSNAWEMSSAGRSVGTPSAASIEIHQQRFPTPNPR